MALRKPTAGGNVAPSLQPNEPRVAAPAGPEPRTLTLPASMSGAGGIPDELRFRNDPREPAPEPVTQEPAMRAFDDQGTPNALGELVQRLATLEHKFDLLESAMDAGFKQVAQVQAARPRVIQNDHVPMPATRQEEAAYSQENFRRFKAQDPEQAQFNGIDAWRAAGRPGL